MTKKILELLLCLLHPIAVVLIWIELLQRDDIGSFCSATNSSRTIGDLVTDVVTRLPMPPPRECTLAQMQS